MEYLLTQSYSEWLMKRKDTSYNSQGTKGVSTLLIQYLIESVIYITC